VAGGVITLISLLPLESVAYRSVTLHVAIETAATFVALLCSVLVFGRYRRSRPVATSCSSARCSCSSSRTSAFRHPVDR